MLALDHQDGIVAAHSRLDSLEYDLTIRDLLGVDAPASPILQYDDAGGDFRFADFAGAQPFSDPLYGQ
jgi:hypothetical protein